MSENTEQFHTEYTKYDMLGFDVIDGKYKFDASWDYFYINHEKKPKPKKNKKKKLQGIRENIKSYMMKAFIKPKHL